MPTQTRPRSTPLSAAAVRPTCGMRHRRPQYRRGAAVCVQGPSFHPLFVARRGANRTVALSASTVSLSLFGEAAKEHDLTGAGAAEHRLPGASTPIEYN